MVCKHCGTEIADKAIICYRCGAGTTDPVRQPARVTRRRSPLLSLIAIAVMLLLALYMGQASRTAAIHPNLAQTLAGVLAGAAVVLLILRVVRRR